MSYFAHKARTQIKKLELDTRYVEYVEGVAITHRQEAGVTYKNFDKVAFLDWDWPNPAHKVERCVTIETLQDAVDLVKPWLGKNPDQSMRLYETPGGVRGILTGKLQTVEEFVALNIHAMQPDPLYIEACERRRSFGVRISPKLGRAGDFVARHVCTLGAAECATIAAIIAVHHDAYLLTLS